MRISDWSSDVCSSVLFGRHLAAQFSIGELLIADDIDLPDFGFRPFINFKDDVDTILIQLHHLRINCCRETALTPVQLDNAGNVSPYLGPRKNLTRRQLDFRLNFFVLQPLRSEENTFDLQSLMRISYAVFCLKTTKQYNFRVQPQLQHNP